MKIPKIIAHRGLWRTLGIQENSLEAFKNAQNLPIYGSEFDVRMTKDERIVVSHDDEIFGQSISENNFEDFKKSLLKFDFKIETLEEFLEQAKQNTSLKSIVEIKDFPNEKIEKRMVEKVLEIVNQKSMNNHVKFISFSLTICSYLKQISQNSKVMYLNGDLSPAEIKNLNLDGMNYDFETYMKNPNWISESKKLGLKTGCWTVNERQKALELHKLGIDYITTDYPNEILNLFSDL